MQRINAIVDAKIVAHHKNQKKRDYLGVSIIGDECARKVQLQYEGNEGEFSPATLRTFDIGHCLEDLVAEWLCIAGFDLKTKDENGEQFGFSTAGGRIKGHVDGLIYAFPEELANAAQEMGEASRLLWECKTLHHKSWQETAKKGFILSGTLLSKRKLMEYISSSIPQREITNMTLVQSVLIISFSVVPSFVFHSVKPLALPPTTKDAA